MRIMRALRRLIGRLRPWAVKARRGTLVRCESCQQWVGVLYAMPGLVGMAAMVELRCEDCRTLWHQAIRDYYAHRAAEGAAARYDRERVGTHAPEQEAA